MSLADELLADLDDAEAAEEVMCDVTGRELEDFTMALVSNDSTTNDPLLEKSSVFTGTTAFSDAPVTAYAKLRNTDRLTKVMNDLDYFSKRPKRDKIHGPVEADQEYQCIVEANNLMVEIDNEINIIHKYVRDLYSKRFPELESLVLTCLDYLKTVLVLGNNILERSKQTDLLAPFLTPATIMVVSVTASTTQGSPLQPDQLTRIEEACQMAIELHEMRITMLTYVESRMSFIAPNISILVGASTAAKLMGHAGGLTALTKMPSCNILVLGAQKRLLSGFSNTSVLPHTGYIYNSEAVQKLPPDLRLKAARLIANKLALAARVDLFHEASDGTIGEKLLLEVERKFDKWQEPPPVKTIKALPAPIDLPAKKRGGRRYRKMKERLGLTEMRRSANRIQFGEISDDAYQSDLGFSLGSLGQRGIAGRLRAPQADSKTKARVSKALQQKLSRFGGMSTMPTTALGATTWGGSSTVRRSVAGTSSSIAFTPLQVSLTVICFPRLLSSESYSRDGHLLQDSPDFAHNLRVLL
ncbi:U4/U6 small nuclear ribonucleoprotein Prp31 (Predicted) [Fasciolopsis buskii]|uniref:U4/U6 small nuclear ribonucleoprotein Prp31 n=1 Tax=Fasciolopsis buskii TaxID=27845 RepID=A0A8E0RN18_9TREM|nr:U4/U6 small nuclear ribonucleoprotein Prp31 (Predicted) [Fasciolopsis buski]